MFPYRLDGALNRDFERGLLVEDLDDLFDAVGVEHHAHDAASKSWIDKRHARVEMLTQELLLGLQGSRSLYHAHRDPGVERLRLLLLLLLVSPWHWHDRVLCQGPSRHLVSSSGVERRESRLVDGDSLVRLALARLVSIGIWSIVVLVVMPLQGRNAIIINLTSLTRRERVGGVHLLAGLDTTEIGCCGTTDCVWDLPGSGGCPRTAARCSLVDFVHCHPKRRSRPASAATAGCTRPGCNSCFHGAGITNFAADSNTALRHLRPPCSHPRPTCDRANCCIRRDFGTRLDLC